MEKIIRLGMMELCNKMGKGLHLMKLIMELMELALYDIVQIATVALELFGMQSWFYGSEVFYPLAEEGS